MIRTTEFYMRQVSNGFKGSISWVEPLGKTNTFRFSIIFGSHTIKSTSQLSTLFQDLKAPFICRFLPYVGYVTIIMTENPIIKVCILSDFSKYNNVVTYYSKKRLYSYNAIKWRK